MSVRYSPEHQWADTGEPAAARIGITRHAQDTLGDIVFVELPEVGRVLRRGEVAGVVESVKAASDVHAPLSGEVIAVNEALRADPSLANRDPEGDGWFFQVKPSAPQEFDALLEAPAYSRLTQDA
ncbi:glycine cleavage system protein GcvH [Xylophilus ampelinus]|uniref:Glycine cleavage system H protein n=1 Tax=Xylophilus ampelinus TaxID=54067 RepID=A0A318SLJ7_9BURK|nr:glycine cleavage system protein GcvH [Xylophilus ampelinus]MCS4509077.1 glycine cleavage system protein GcvH [Xylophilus ampelinus]PYE79896.1 glycine cleavage system H protein [Xylophilus ampelinus]